MKLKATENPAWPVILAYLQRAWENSPFYREGSPQADFVGSLRLHWWIPGK